MNVQQQRYSDGEDIIKPETKRRSSSSSSSSLHSVSSNLNPTPQGRTLLTPSTIHHQGRGVEDGNNNNNDNKNDNVNLRYKYDRRETPIMRIGTNIRKDDMYVNNATSYHTKRQQHSHFVTGAHAAEAVANAARENKKISQLDELFDFDT